MSESEPPPPVAAAPVGPMPILDVAVGTPDVNGTSEEDVAPVKAGICVEADGSGIAMLLLGLRTF